MEPEKKSIMQKKYMAGFVVILLVFVVLTLYFWSEARGLKKSPGEIEAQEIADTVLEVSKIMLLPKDENPTLATVSDPEKLKDQPFFKNAEVGHKVLIYTQAQKAILYDPVRNLIIEVAPINIDGSNLQK